MPSLAITLLAAFQLVAADPRSACISQPVSAGEVTTRLDHAGFKPVVTAKTPVQGISAIWAVRPDGAWVEVWLFGTEACLVDAGTAWTNIQAGQTAKPEEAAPPSGPPTESPDGMPLVGPEGMTI